MGYEEDNYLLGRKLPEPTKERDGTADLYELRKELSDGNMGYDDQENIQDGGIDVQSFNEKFGVDLAKIAKEKRFDLIENPGKITFETKGKKYGELGAVHITKNSDKYMVSFKLGQIEIETCIDPNVAAIKNLSPQQKTLQITTLIGNALELNKYYVSVRLKHEKLDKKGVRGEKYGAICNQKECFEQYALVLMNESPLTKEKLKTVGESYDKIKIISAELLTFINEQVDKKFHPGEKNLDHEIFSTLNVNLAQIGDKVELKSILEKEFNQQNQFVKTTHNIVNRLGISNRISNV